MTSGLADVLTPAGLSALLQVLVVDLVLAGDNAVVVGSLAAGLPRADRRRVIVAGIAVALVLRIAFALIATRLVRLIGLLLAGGLLLLWVAWRFWRELRMQPQRPATSGIAPPRSLAAAAWSIALADVSMSLDNVLGVVGAARGHMTVLVIGLVMSVALMGLAAGAIARIIERQRWIAYAGLVVIVWIAARMIYNGIVDPQTGVMRLVA